MRIDVDITGLREIERALKRLPTRTVERISRKALSAGARLVRDDARRRAPFRTGRLKKSIKVKARRSRRNVITVSVLTKVRYSHLVELGTHERFVKKNKRFVGAMPARPFMRPALEVNRHKALDVYKRVMWREIRREVRGA